MNTSTNPARRGACPFAPCAVLVALWWTGTVAAQTSPDAGSVLQQIESQRTPTLPSRTATPFQSLRPLQGSEGETVTIHSFRFEGNTLLRDAELATVVAPFLHRPLDFNELKNAAIAVAQTYRDRGWVARVYLPEQTMGEGAVTIQVIEARFGKVRVEGDARSVSRDRLARFVHSAQVSNQPVRGTSLERALLLIDDLPGIRVEGRLAEGSRQAETDLVVRATDDPWFSGEVTADNIGSRLTGAARVAATVALHSPLRFGDQVTALALHSKGNDYLQASYTIPVGSQGWRLGVHGSRLTYRVISSELAALDANGSSNTVGVDASYPLVRARQQNLLLTLGADSRRFDNESAGVVSSRYRTRIATIGLSGNRFDDVGRGGVNHAHIALTVGKVDLDGSPHQGLDASTARTGGSFRKVRFTAARQQAITGTLSLHGSVAGQLASKNLDSSERFYLGGIQGIRAYPAHEGGGSEGLLLSLEVRKQLPARVSLVGFLDWGRVRVNKEADFAGAAVPSAFDLKGVGTSMGWTSGGGMDLKATIARRIGANPNATASGTDQDGSRVKTRLWIQASMPF